MLHDILGHGHIQWHPSLIRHFKDICNGCGMPTEDAYSSGHLVLSHLGLTSILMLRPFIPEIVISMDLLSFKHPSVLLFCPSTWFVCDHQGHLPYLYATSTPTPYCQNMDSTGLSKIWHNPGLSTLAYQQRTDSSLIGTNMEAVNNVSDKIDLILEAWRRHTPRMIQGKHNFIFCSVSTSWNRKDMCLYPTT